MSTVLAWHFLPQDRRLQFDPRTLVEVGQAIIVDPPIVLCQRGLHASIRAIDALQYAPGPIVCRVQMDGEIKHDNDKLVASCRTVMAMADATATLHEFACRCAERVLHLCDDAEPTARAAIETKRRWLAGTATDKELAFASDAASDAAWAAASDAARVAARVAARDAAKDAAKAAAWAAARDAAWDAARAPAWAFAKDAARDAQNADLESMLTELLQLKESV